MGKNTGNFNFLPCYDHRSLELVVILA